jgi:DNA repair photolyase
VSAPPDLRWRLADDDPQGTLFDEVERHVGRGEFRGMEFLHVRARRIINEVPKTSAVPFRYTINAYRGCSHACVYCISGDTPVLLAEGRLRPIADLHVGDLVVGTDRVGRYRRYVATPVLAHWSTVKPAFRVTLEDGATLVASGDHRFLTERGWKHVTGTGWGAGCRPHLTANNALLGIGPVPRGPIASSPYQRGYLCGIQRGDGSLAHRAYHRRGGAAWVHHAFRLALVDLEPLTRARSYLQTASVPTTEFPFAAATGNRQAIRAIGTQARAPVERMESLIEWPSEPCEEWTKGFLAGIYDAAGHLGGVIRISNEDPEILAQVSGALARLGFRSVCERPKPNGVGAIRLLGGLPEIVRFILTVDPATTRKRTITGRAMKGTGARRVVSVEPLGLDLPMYDITTGTGDFIANGVVSHNCFARPTHEYLGMDAGEDFERRIVVKVNAVERLRAELAPGRWAGDHIAMGTNTDPYQRCEGKYRLTRGIVGVLTEAANPFSILTKSTLVLSDLELLAEAARRTQVAVNLSIGTLDEDVWRATEPGTPHPMKRVEAVARLNEAGVPSGVLVAPVLPGLSDRPEQLEAVVKACVEAGARSISPILLHLRPGVREQYLGWLAGARPDLMDEHAHLYPRAYAPKATQNELSRLVAGMVARHGGRSASAGEARAVEPSRRSRPRPARQLHLGL